MNVLFVCLGNICRSPLGEAMFKELVKDSDINVDSAGTGSWNIGQRPHQEVKKILDELDISYENMRARQITQEDFIKYDYILAMDKENLKDLKFISNQKYHHKIHLFLDVLKDEDNNEVPDPWHTKDFDETKDLIETANPLWYDKIKTQL